MFVCASDTVWEELSARTRNALLVWNVPPTPTGVSEYFSGNADKLLQVANMGVKCRKELNAWLIRHGKAPIPYKKGPAEAGP